MAFALMSLCACADKTDAPRAIAGADAARGLAVIDRVGCAACHRIPGVAWPTGSVGGSLDGFADRSLIAGRLPNTAEELARFIRDPSAVKPGTAMPTMGVTPEHARLMADYLLKQD